MTQYKKKSIVINAIENIGINHSEIKDFATGSDRDFSFEKNGEVTIATLEGKMTAGVGDFIIKGIKGEFYPCKPDIFKATYDKV